MIKVQKV